MIWKGWNNGGSGYGFSVDPADFDPLWTDVIVELPSGSGLVVISANVAKASFTRKCPHLIDTEIGRWMRDEGHAPWPAGKPPRFNVEPNGTRRFRIGTVA